MVTKFKYNNEKGLVSRSSAYSFTAIEDLSYRLSSIDNDTVLQAVANTTLKGEADRETIAFEDTWFKVQDDIQTMDVERATLESRLVNGDRKGNPLTPDRYNVVAGRVAELKEGTIVVTKEFYNHYNRETITVDDVTQTPYTIALEARAELEAENPFLKGLRGEEAPARPTPSLSEVKETVIRKELVRQRIYSSIGDIADLLADVSNAVAPLIKKVDGVPITELEQSNIDKYVSRQSQVVEILSESYM